MSYYAQNRKRARTINTDPTMTDQSQASHTDINIIVKNFRVTGELPKGNPGTGGDFTQLPGDLRSMIEASRNIGKLRHQLPQPLRELPIEELLTLTPAKLETILTPAKPAVPAGNKEDPK